MIYRNYLFAIIISIARHRAHFIVVIQRGAAATRAAIVTGCGGERHCRDTAPGPDEEDRKGISDTYDGLGPVPAVDIPYPTEQRFV